MNTVEEEEGSWLPPPEPDNSETFESVKTHLAKFRDNNPLSENQLEIQKFYRAFFAEHSGQELGRDADDEEELVADQGSTCDGDGGGGREENDGSPPSKRFTDACESNSLDCRTVQEVCRCLSWSDVELSACGFNNLVAFLSNQSKLVEAHEASITSLLRQSFAGPVCAVLSSDRQFLDSVFLMLEHAESVVVNGLLTPWIDLVMTFDGGQSHAKATAELAQSLISAIKVEENRVEVGRCLLRNRTLNESSLGFIDTILLKDNLIQVCIKHRNVLAQLAAIVSATSSENESLRNSSKLGRFVVGLLKRLPREIPKESYQLLSVAVLSQKNFLKRAAEVELQKHSPTLT